jgi:hypothetical protein
MPHSVSFAATTSAVRTSSKHSSGWAWMSRRIGRDGGRLGDDGVQDVHGDRWLANTASLARRRPRHRGYPRECGDGSTTAVSPRALELAQALVRMNTVSANSNLR